MNITFANIGRFKSAECEALVAYYLKLARRFATVKHVGLELPRNAAEEQAQDLALERWLEKRGPRAHLCILDEQGLSFTSMEFAKKVKKIRDGSFTEWIIVVAGAHGFTEKIRQKAGFLWSLSPLTFPHELAAAVAAEQVFRALSILHGHPYHKEC